MGDTCLFEFDSEQWVDKIGLLEKTAVGLIFENTHILLEYYSVFDKVHKKWVDEMRRGIFVLYSRESILSKLIEECFVLCSVGALI